MTAKTETVEIDGVSYTVRELMMDEGLALFEATGGEETSLNARMLRASVLIEGKPIDAGTPITLRQAMILMPVVNRMNGMAQGAGKND
jgi:hypothetical protein